MAIALLPFQGTLVITAGGHFQMSELIMVAVIASAFMNARAGTLQRSSLPMLIPLSVLTAVVVASSIQTFAHLPAMTSQALSVEYEGARNSPQLRSFVTSVIAVFSLLSFIAITQLILSRHHVAAAVRVLVVSAAVAGAWGLAQFVFLSAGIVITLPGDISHLGASHVIAGGLVRANSTFIEPSTFGAYMLLIIPLTVAAVARPGQFQMRRRTLVACLCFQLGGLLVSFSVGQIMSLILVLAATPFVVGRIGGVAAVRKVRAGILILGAIMCILPATLALTSHMGDALLIFQTKVGGVDDSLPDRLHLADIGWHMFRDNPLFGVGIGNSAFLYVPYAGQLGYQFSHYSVVTSANLYVTVLAELGLVGVVALTNVVWFALRHLGRALRTKGGSDTTLLIGFVGSCVAIAATSNFLDNLFVLAFWVVGALGVCATRLAWSDTADTAEWQPPATE